MTRVEHYDTSYWSITLRTCDTVTLPYHIMWLSDEWRWVEGIMVGSEAIDFHAYSTSCPPAL